jgi:hypothetical protein
MELDLHIFQSLQNVFPAAGLSRPEIDCHQMRNKS